MNNIGNLAQKIVNDLAQLLHGDPSLKEKTTDTLERYLNDRLWPSNFFELEKALSRLNLGLPELIRVYFVNADMFAIKLEQSSSEINDFLIAIRENYAYKYRVGAFRTIFSSLQF